MKREHKIDNTENSYVNNVPWFAFLRCIEVLTYILSPMERCLHLSATPNMCKLRNHTQ